MPCLTPSVVTVLGQAYEPAATFSAAEIALIEPLLRAVAPVVPADARKVRQSIGSLAVSMPSQATDMQAGALKLSTYMSMIGEVDARALEYACRRCLDELDWFPTVRQLKERIAAYVSPEQEAIFRARHIALRGARRMEEEEGPVAPMTPEALAAMARSEIGRACLSFGLTAGHITQAQYDAAMTPIDEGAAGTAAGG